MTANVRSNLIADGAIRNSCSEAITKVKCLSCGTTLYTAIDWERNDQTCPDCGGSGHIYVCDRCEKKFDELPSNGEHPCGSIVLYDNTRRITFEVEAQAKMESRRLAERRHAEAEARRHAQEEERRRAEEESRLRIENEERRREEEKSRLTREMELRRRAEDEARSRAEYESRRRVDESERRREEIRERLRSAWVTSKAWLILALVATFLFTLLWAGLGYVLLQFDAESVARMEQVLTGLLALGSAILIYTIANGDYRLRNSGALFAVVTFFGVGWVLMQVFPVALTGSRNFWKPVFANLMRDKVVVNQAANVVDHTPKVTESPLKAYPLDTTVNGRYLVHRNSNIRSGPGPRFSIVTTVTQFSDVGVLGRHELSGWYQVAEPGKVSSATAIGYISGKLLTAWPPNDVLQRSGCLACHKVGEKLVGPSFKDIAAKYRGQGVVTRSLQEKVRNGGKGTWGVVPMPPNPTKTVSDADLKRIVEWILALE